jgi:hypothetical protein
MSVARPPSTVLRNPLRNFIKKHVGIALVLSIGAAAAWKFGVNDPKRAKYKEFFRLVLKK